MQEKQCTTEKEEGEREKKNMITIRVIRKGREGYYLRPERSEGTEEGMLPYLEGSGAELLNMRGDCLHWADKRLKKLLQGIHPITGDRLKNRLTERQGKDKVFKPVIGYDVVANAPKDVSILGLVLKEERVIELHERAVESTIRELDQHCFTRKRGKLEQVSPIVLVQTHITNRNLEPHLHSHCLILNTGLISESKGGALEGRRLLKAWLTLSRAYQAHLEELVRGELHLSTHPVRLKHGDVFGVREIPEELRLRFSSRSEEIKEAVGNKRLSGAAIRVIALKTRSPKQREITRESLERSWQEEYSHSLTLEQVPKLPAR